MKYNLYLLLLSMLLSHIGISQPASVSNIESYTVNLVTIFDKLESVWDSFSGRLEAKRAYRELKDVGTDLEAYLNARSLLLEELKANNFDNKNENTIKAVKRLQKRMESLSYTMLETKFFTMDSDVGSAVISFVDSVLIFQAIQWDGRGKPPKRKDEYSKRRGFLADLEAFLNGENIDKDDLIRKSEDVRKKLEKALLFIYRIRDGIKESYDL